MTKMANNTRTRLKSCVSNLALLAVLTLSGNASAELLNDTLDAPGISFSNKGGITYSAMSDEFNVDASLDTLLVFPGPVVRNFSPDGSLVINITVDDTGALTGVPAGDDLVVTGTMDLGAGPVTGVLLTGKVTGFGFFNSDGNNDSFDFTFNLTGGDLAHLYPTGAVGITVGSEASSFNNDFNVHFSGKAKGTLGSVPGQVASLGDRVWEDLDADGLQDCADSNDNGILGDVDPNDPYNTNAIVSDQGTECGDLANGGAGIAGVTVTLGQPDKDDVCIAVYPEQSTTTGDDGLYLFDNLVPGDYCVRFGSAPADLCDAEIDGVIVNLGAAKFTKQNAVKNGMFNDEIDSDADPADGTTGSVSLGSSEVNRSIDAGFVCPAKIGNFVWEDLNKDGLQQRGEPGVDGVVVELFECGIDGKAGSTDDINTGEFRVTADGGSYMFGAEPSVLDLAPGRYYVKFDPASLPAGYEFTTPNVGGVGGDDTIDSDCRPPSGTAECTTVGSRGIDLSQDCGIVAPPPPACDLDIELLCRVEPRPTTVVGEKCSGKLQQFSLVWAGDGPIEIDSVNMGTTNATGVVEVDDSVTFFGPYDSNDVIVNISDANSGVNIGQSTFHVSCSDDDFNSDDDCNKLNGDGKNNDSGFLNLWRLEGFVDGNGDVLDCSGGANTGEFLPQCSYAAPAPVSCGTDADGDLDKVQSVTFAYTGGGCPGSNDQGSKTSCSGSLEGASDARIEVETDEGYMTAKTSVTPGETFTVTRGGENLRSHTIVTLSNSGSQENDVHTSCSAPLSVGDVFGALTVVGLNGETGGVDVTYKYVVTNNGVLEQTDIKVTDDPLGPIGIMPSLVMNDMGMFTKITTINGTTVNTATATSAEGCMATDMVIVEELGPPPCEVISDSIIKLNKKKLEWKIQNVGTGDAVIERIEITWPNSINGDLDKVKLGKKEIVSDDLSGPNAVIISFHGSVQDRTLEADKTQTLKFEFMHDVSKNFGDYGILKVVFAEGCEVVFDPANIPPAPFVCSDAKPIDSLSMIWNGPNGVDVVSPTGDRVDGVVNGQEVSFSGLSGMGNDVFWDIQGAGLSGSSRFHVSCSDQDMNGPEDCGGALGDGKDNNAGNINLWRFEGMQGTNGVGLDCSVLP